MQLSQQKTEKLMSGRPGQSRNKVHLAILILLSISILLLFDLSPFGGNIRFYSKWIQCGQKPVRITSSPGAGMAWYEVPPSLELVRFGQSKYFCTASQAHAAGYASSPYSY